MAESIGGISSVGSINSAFLRQKLRETMVLGLPVTPTERPTFYFQRDVDWAEHDREGNPWDWTASPTLDVQAAPVAVICAYEFFSPLGRQGAQYTPAGEFNPTTVVFTFFEDEFAEIEGFSNVTVGPGTQNWYFRYWRPAYSLGALTVYQVQCVAEGVA